MDSVHLFTILLTFLGILTAYQFKAQSPPNASSTAAARSLDALLQDYAYRAFDRPRTGVPYGGDVPSNISGIKITAVRLRSGSLRFRGLKSFKEFEIPMGVIEQPYVQRLALVYQNLGNWSSIYYRLPGYTFLAPVLGLLAYEATNISATNLPELDIIASMKPISIRFTGVRPVPGGLSAKCVWFNLDGSPQLNDSATNNVCTTYRQGHFSIVVNSTAIAPPTPSASPGRAEKDKSKVWKIVGAAVGGFLALVLLALVVVWVIRYRQNRKTKEMMQRAESGEVLRMQWVGNARLPVAPMIRTRPTLENDYAP